MIPNTDNYLLLKQLLIVLEVLRKNGEINTEHRKLTIDDVSASAISVIGSIRGMFTIPYILATNREVALDLSKMNHEIRELFGTIPDNSEWGDLYRVSNNPEYINKLVEKYPTMDFVIRDHGINIKENRMWGGTRNVAGSLINSTEDGLNVIQAWIDNRDKKPLVQMLVLSNCIELVDRIFSYVNDIYGGEHNDD